MDDVLALIAHVKAGHLSARGDATRLALHTHEGAEYAAAAVRAHFARPPEVAVILGTGLSGVAEEIDVDVAIEYADIPEFPLSTVESHAGRLLCGRLGGKTIVAMDTDEATLNWIQKGRIAGTIAQKPFTMAYFGANMLDATYHRKLNSLDVNTASDPFSTFPAFVDTGATLIDKNNISGFTKSRDSAKSE